MALLVFSSRRASAVLGSCDDFIDMSRYATTCAIVCLVLLTYANIGIGETREFMSAAGSCPARVRRASTKATDVTGAKRAVRLLEPSQPCPGALVTRSSTCRACLAVLIIVSLRNLLVSRHLRQTTTPNNSTIVRHPRAVITATSSSASP